MGRRLMKRILLAVAAVVGMIALMPAAARDWTGRWSVRTADRTFTIITISPDAKAAERWNVDIARPKDSYFNASAMVGNLGPTVAVRHCHALNGPNDDLLVTYDDPRPDEAHESIVFSIIGNDNLISKLVPYGLNLLFSRATPNEVVSTDWTDLKDEIPLVQAWPDNMEMTSLFERDQADRRDDKVDWTKILTADGKRLNRVKEMLVRDELHSANDFWHAAFLYQHGKTSANYLIAHTLAVVAAAKGRSDAAWIAAATLDRYLQSLGLPQVYGTQYITPRGGATTQEPFDRAIVPDSVRLASGVPRLADQANDQKAP